MPIAERKNEILFILMQGYLVYNLNNGIEGKMSGLALLEAFTFTVRTLPCTFRTPKEMIEDSNYSIQSLQLNPSPNFLTPLRYRFHLVFLSLS